MKLFTVEEANLLLPELRRLIEQIQRQRRVLQNLAPEIKMAAARASEGGGSPSGGRYLQSLRQIRDAAEAIGEMGIQVKDFDMGLCDFPAMHEGRVVLLCWKYGEDAVAWWHDTDSGYSGRQPL
ncbi:MAG: DUF2203 domain-containing protein [Blastocatellia bacterium]